MTAAQRAEKIWLASLVDGKEVWPGMDPIAAEIKEAETAASDAALVFVVQLLRRSGSLGAAKLVEALLEDSRRMGAGKKTEFATLRESVPLPQ